MDKAKQYDMLLKIDEQRHALDDAQHKYLEARGWLYSSSYVGCHWMWCKKIDDRQVVVNTETALSLQNAMDCIAGYYDELAPEEEG